LVQQRTASNYPEDVFSSFVFENNCTSDKRSVFIEPLAGILRHPSVCSSPDTLWSWVGNREYLALDCRTYLTHDNQKPKAYYFDLGASYWTSSSQSWFYEQYVACGITFAGFYLWEADELPVSEVWRQVPVSVKPFYHWYNIPANADPASADNPLNYLRLLARPEDFVVLKLDIDNSPLEKRFIEQLLAEPKLLALVDDFFFRTSRQC